MVSLSGSQTTCVTPFFFISASTISGLSAAFCTSLTIWSSAASSSSFYRGSSARGAARTCEGPGTAPALRFCLADRSGTGVRDRLGSVSERADPAVDYLDDDLGKSGANADDRLGFQRLVSEVSLEHVGLILGLEMSRLARSNRDWHQSELVNRVETVEVENGTAEIGLRRRVQGRGCPSWPRPSNWSNRRAFTAAPPRAHRAVR